MSFNFMAAVTIHSDIGAPQNKVWLEAPKSLPPHMFGLQFHLSAGTSAEVVTRPHTVVLYSSLLGRC